MGSYSASEITIPTVETLQQSTVAQLLLGGNNPVLLCGVSGSGKTVVARQLLQHLAVSESAINLEVQLSHLAGPTALQVPVSHACIQGKHFYGYLRCMGIACPQRETFFVHLEIPHVRLPERLGV